MQISFSDAFEYLEQRGAPYGIPLRDMIEKTPRAIQGNPARIVEFWQNKDISHVLPVSSYPELAGDPGNWFPEDVSENRGKKDSIRTLTDIAAAEIDNQSDVFDRDYNDDGVADAGWG